MFALMGGAGLMAASAASASTGATYAATGGYQFASNYQLGTSNVWQVLGGPIAQPTASEALAGHGVNLVAGDDTAKDYSSAAVIVDLGKLSSLFRGGAYVAPKIVGSRNLAVNYYFDTNGNGHYLSFDKYNGFYQGPGGDNLASISGDTADFTTFTQGDTTIGLAGQLTMEDVLAKYKARASGTTDPEVWAWIGVQNGPATTGYVSSVAGKPLTESFSATGPISTFTDYSASCLDNTGASWTGGNWTDGNPLQIWKCGAAGGVNQRFRLAGFSDGSGELQAVKPDGEVWCVTATTRAARLTIEACPAPGSPLPAGQAVAKVGAVYHFGNGLVMGDKGSVTTNGNPVNGEAPNGSKAQEWSVP
jgi:hypothetical protein